MKKFTKIFVIIGIASLAGGCAEHFIEKKSGSEAVSVVDAKQVEQCQSIGKVTSSVTAKVGFISRSVEGVEENLLQMAKNSAIEDGGDSLVKAESTEFGKRVFKVYKCK